MGKKILLADDSVTIQKVIKLTFSDEDFEVTTLGNGRLAIEKAEEIQPDLVLSDIIMPEKDGYEVCEHIKSSSGLQNVPVLLLTGAFEPFDVDRANRVGADGYLAKPFEPQALVDRVKELLDNAASDGTSPEAGAERPTFSVRVPVVPGEGAGPGAQSPAAPKAPASYEAETGGGVFIPDEPDEPDEPVEVPKPTAPEPSPEVAPAASESFAEEMPAPERQAGPEVESVPETASAAPAEGSEWFEGDWNATRRFDPPAPVPEAVPELELAAALQPEPAPRPEPAPAVEAEPQPEEASLVQEDEAPSAFAGEAPATFSDDEAATEASSEGAAEGETVAKPYYSSPGEQEFELPSEKAPSLKLAEKRLEPEEGGAFGGEEVSTLKPELEPELEPVTAAPPEPAPARPAAASAPAAEPVTTSVAVPVGVAQELLPSAATSDSADLDVSDELIERIAKRVSDHLLKKVLQDVAWGVVPDLAEGLIKDEIARVKGQLEEAEKA